MILLTFFIIVCVLEVLCLVALGFAYWGLVRLEGKLKKARRQLYVYKHLLSRQLRMGHIGMDFIKHSFEIVRLFLPWWVRIGLFGLLKFGGNFSTLLKRQET